MAIVGLKAVVRLPYTTGIDRDVSENTFFFGSGDDVTPDAMAADVAARLKSFYNDTAAGASNALGVYLSGVIDRGTNKCLITYYDATPPLGTAGHPEGPPLATTDEFTLASVEDVTTDLPEEVALCLSYYGTGPSSSGVTLPKPRRAGRIYLGPLSGAAIATDATYALPAAAFVTDLCAAGAALLTADTTTANWTVYSRGSAKGVASPPAMTQIVAGFVDNAWDTQRRRGTDPTHKTGWP